MLPYSFVEAESRKLWLTVGERELVDALLAGEPTRLMATVAYERLAVAVHNLGVMVVPHDVEIGRDSRLGLW